MGSLIDEDKFILVPDIAKQCGVSVPTVHSWLRYHGYMKWHRVFRNVVVERADFERFKRERPDLARKVKAVV